MFDVISWTSQQYIKVNVMEIKVMNKTNAQLVRKILDENLPSINEKQGLMCEWDNAK